MIVLFKKHICIICLNLVLLNYCECITGTNSLLVISLDGFKHEYLERNITPFLNYMGSKGVLVKRLVPQYPSVTMPNHHTIATGVLPEHHGVVNNMFYDKHVRKHISYTDNEMYAFNKSVIPIWTENELQGGVSGSLMWFGAEFPYEGRSISYFLPYKEIANWDEVSDKALQWFTDPVKPANLIMMYFEELDSTGHHFGPNSNELNDALKHIDKGLQNLVNSLEAKGLQEKVNLLIVTDHGMSEANQGDQIRFNTSELSRDDTVFVNTNPIINFYTSSNDVTNSLIGRLNVSKDKEKFLIYKKDNLPERYKMKNNVRLGDVIIEAKLGNSFELNFTGNTAKGMHGYDIKNFEMHGVMIGYGKAFATVKMEELSNMIVYSVICKILDINCSHKTQKLEALVDTVVLELKPTGYTAKTKLGISVLIIFLTMAVIKLLVYYIRKHRTIAESLKFDKRTVNLKSLEMSEKNRLIS